MWQLMALIPDEALILVPVGLAFMIMFQIISFSGAMTLLGSVLLVYLLAPFVSCLLDRFPDWVVYGLLLLLSFSLLRAMLQALVGRGATDHFVGNLLFALFMQPVRILGRLFTVLLGRRMP
jgi:hypothetical protein